MRRIIAALLLTGSIALPATADQGAPLKADHVVAVRVPTDGDLSFSLWCEAEDRRSGGYFDDAVVGEGAVYEGPSGRSMNAYLFEMGDVRTSKGSALVVGDATVVAQTREDPRYRLLGFGIGVTFIFFGVSATLPTEIVFTVATWGSAPVCEVDQGGPTYPLVEQPGATAYYAGPHAFQTGVLAQDRRDQVAVARSSISALPGGPVLALMHTGHASGGVLAATGSDPDSDANGCTPVWGYPDGCSVQLGSYAADRIVATTPASISLGGWDLGLYVIALPPTEEPS